MLYLTPDTIINKKYHLQRPLGRGGFSIVWLALDLERSNKPVALKFSIPEMDREGEQVNRMKRQHEITQALQHKYLLCSIAFFMHEDSGCLVFDYMVGGTLHNQVKLHGGLPELEVAKMMLQIGEAIQYLHSKLLVHFDIKPENILIDGDGNYRLADFDTAARLENSMVRVARIYADTPQYRSPEHLRGADELSEKVDIFAFGITIFETCEGIMEKEFGIGMALLSGLAKPEFRGKYARRLMQIVHACWNHNPSDRPSAEALVSYAENRINKGYWSHVLEYHSNDKPLIGVRNQNSSTARVTVGHYANTPVKKEEPVPFGRASLKKSFGKAQIYGGNVIESILAKSQVRDPDSKVRKWIVPGLVVLVVMVCILLFTYPLISRYQYSRHIDKALELKAQNRLKDAFSEVTIARKLLPGDSNGIKVRREIIRASYEQHKVELKMAAAALKTKDEIALAECARNLEMHRLNASILILDDSTNFYLGRIKAVLKHKSVPDVIR